MIAPYSMHLTDTPFLLTSVNRMTTGPGVSFPVLSFVAGILPKLSCSNAGPVTARGCAAAVMLNPRVTRSAGRARRMVSSETGWGGDMVSERVI